MSDWMMLYLFTRLDALQTGLILSAVALALMLFFATIFFSFQYSDGENVAGFRKPLISLVVAVIVVSCFAIAIPSQRDMAIIVGGSFALDASRSDSAKEISQEVLDAIRAQLKRAAKQ